MKTPDTAEELYKFIDEKQKGILDSRTLSHDEKEMMCMLICKTRQMYREEEQFYKEPFMYLGSALEIICSLAKRENFKEYIPVVQEIVRNSILAYGKFKEIHDLLWVIECDKNLLKKKLIKKDNQNP